MRILTVSLAAALAIALAGPVSPPLAAQNSLDQFELAFQTREGQRRATISGTMAFTEEEAAQFWPAYDAYRATAKSHQLRRLQLVKLFAQNAVDIENETAQTIIDSALKLDHDQHEARGLYLSKIEPYFDGARYFRLYQLEIKLDALFRASWTQQIPLAVTQKELERLQMGMQGEHHDASLPTI